MCVCVCYLVDFLPSVLISHPCNHDNSCFSSKVFFSQQTQTKKIIKIVLQHCLKGSSDVITHTHTCIDPAGLRTDGGVVLQQQLAAVGGAAHHGGVIQRSETSAVLVVRRRSEVQQSLRTRTGIKNTEEDC